MKFSQSPFLFSLLLSLLFFSEPLAAQSGRSVIDNMLVSAKQVDKMTFQFFQIEQLRKGTGEYVTNMKYQKSPMRIYAQTVSPDKNIELLYGDGLYGGNVYVKPNGFPYVNLKLDMFSSHLMKDRHHPLYRTGFSPIIQIIEDAVRRADEQNEDIFMLKADENFEGSACYVVEVQDPTFGFRSYTVKAGEDLCDIGDRYSVGEYMILLKNPKISNFQDVSAGDVIQIPTSYTPKAVVWVDKAKNLPVKLKLYDESGNLYEHFEFRNLDVTPSFDSSTFSDENPAYGF